MRISEPESKSRDQKSKIQKTKLVTKPSESVSTTESDESVTTMKKFESITTTTTRLQSRIFCIIGTVKNTWGGFHMIFLVSVSSDTDRIPSISPPGIWKRLRVKQP